MSQLNKEERAHDERAYASLTKSSKQLRYRDPQGRRNGVPTRSKRKRAEKRMRAKGFEVA